MADAIDQAGISPRQSTVATWNVALADWARAATPPLLFGLRLWTAVCLALYVAFWLELDNAYWAGTSAALMCLPHLGASLRKGRFRMIGTFVGALAIVALTACFPQNRAGFLIGLALWGAACVLGATLLRNFAGHAAALAGITAVIIASDQLGASGGPNGQAFTLAITRVSEFWIGIVCAGIVLAGTDFGDAPRRLAASLAALYAEVASSFGSSLAAAGSASSDAQSGSRELIGQQPVRRELIRQVVALDPVVDETIGESPRLRYYAPVLQAVIDGLFAALAAWRTVAVRLTRLPDSQARQEADAVLRCLPQELRFATARVAPTSWLADPIRMRGLADSSVRSLTAISAGTPSLRLVADQSARVLAGLSDVLNGLALLAHFPEKWTPVFRRKCDQLRKLERISDSTKSKCALGADPARPRSRRRRARLHVPDWLPAAVNAGRAFVAVGAVEVFWIVTAWPNGASALTFTAIAVSLFASRGDEAYAVARSFMLGVGAAAVSAAIVTFAGLPQIKTFSGFSILMGLYLVPVGALLVQPWQPTIFTAMAGIFVPLLAPANQMTYDTVQFYNAALAIVAGCGAAALSFRLLPPLSPALRTRRLLALSLRDLRRLATDPLRRLSEDWESRMYSRIAAVPDAAEPLQRGQLVAALSVGIDIIELRRIAPQLGFTSELDRAIEPLAQGNSAAAIARLERLDQYLASLPNPQTSGALYERARILLICDALDQHRAYFDAAGAPT